MQTVSVGANPAWGELNKTGKTRQGYLRELVCVCVRVHVYPPHPGVDRVGWLIEVKSIKKEKLLDELLLENLWEMKSVQT